MNYFKRLLYLKTHDDDPESANTTVNDVKLKANNLKQKTDCIEILNSSLITSDSSDAASINLADSTENISLNNDGSSDVSAINSTTDQEHLKKHSDDAKYKKLKEKKLISVNSEANNDSISSDSTKMECLNNKSGIQHDAGVTGRSSMIISDSDDSKEIEAIIMDCDDFRAVTIDTTQEMLKTEEPCKKEDKTEVDSNNNLDVLAQFIENNIVDFVQTPRNISEILSDLKEFDMTPNPNNSSGSSQFASNEVMACEDNVSVLMDLDSMYDEIEAIDTFIHDITKRHDEEGFNAITTQDVESVFSEHLNVYKPPLSDNKTVNSPSNTVSTNDIKSQDFEMEIDILKNSNILISNEATFDTKYDFNVQIDVETISTVSSQNSEVSSLEVEFINSIADNVNDKSIRHESNTVTTNKHPVNDSAEPTKNNTSSHVAPSKKLYSKNITARKANRTLNKQCKKKQDNVKIIDTIILSSSDDEDNCPLAVIKRKSSNIKDMSASSHISISSDETYPIDIDDLDYCSGYDSSDFEFITEKEAIEAAFTIRKARRPIRKLPKKTLRIQSIERLDSNCSVKDSCSNEAGTSGLNKDSYKTVDIKGPRALNNNGNSYDVDKAGPSGLNNARNDELNNIASNEGHVIPEGDEYLNLFQGMYERALRPNPYTAENKSCYQRNPTIPGMYIDVDDVGFDLAARRNQPIDEDIDDENSKYGVCKAAKGNTYNSKCTQAREEARQNVNRIMQMYPEENRKKRKIR